MVLCRSEPHDEVAVMNILFVCTANKLRSPTAEAVFAGRPDITVRSAGLDPEAPCRLDAELVAWADKIYAMETHHREKIRKKFKKVLGATPVITLGIRSRAGGACAPRRP
jgi:predicted protein tyrosine phosphatase